MAFQRAVKHDARLRMSISGPSGSGKTWTALTLATRLAGNEPFAVLDTERGSASKYADDFSFDVMELDAFDPRNYVKAIHEAEEAGYTVMVIDSLTHAWNGTGGLLDIVDAIARRKYNNNTFAAWKDATPIQNALIDAITGAKLHIIVTMRAKQEYAMEKDERTGKTSPKKVGMAPIQRDGFEYELDVAVDMDIDNTMIVQKSRCSKLAGQIIPKPDGKVADTLKEWLRGAPVPVVATPKPTEIKEEKPSKQATSAAPRPQQARTQPAPAKTAEQPATRQPARTQLTLVKDEQKPTTNGTQAKPDAPTIERIKASADRVLHDGGYASLKGVFVAKYELGDIADTDIPANIRVEMADAIRAEAKKQPALATSGK